MKAIEITEFGAPDVLKLGERPMPEPKAGEVLIKVAASGVNRPDVFQRKGVMRRRRVRRICRGWRSRVRSCAVTSIRSTIRSV